jgi:hypothetical protein
MKRSSRTSRRIGSTLLGALAALAALSVPAGARVDAGRDAPLPLPARVGGVTKGGEQPSDVKTSISCADTKDVAWYRFSIARRGPVLIELKASEKLDAAMGIYRERRSGVGEVGCRRTDQHGAAQMAIWAKPQDTLYVGVGRLATSTAGTFALRVRQAERPATPPGTPIARGSVASSVDALLDPDDAWSVKLAAGHPYRFHLLSRTRNQCVEASLFAPDTVSFDQEYALGRVFGCDGRRNYMLFTPGPDGGGVYTLRVTADPAVPGTQRYRLLAAPASADDAAPGIQLENGANVRGTLFGRGADVVDLYSFSVTKLSVFRAELLTKPGVGFDLTLLGQHGSVIGTFRSERPGRLLRFRELDVGLYYLAVGSRDRAGGRYRLGLSVRELTETRMAIDGLSVTSSVPGTSHTLTATVYPAGYGGTVRFQLDRLDPLAGWQFVGFVDAAVQSYGTASASWLPPSPGDWRIRGRFLGTSEASVSQSGPVRLYVGPLAGAV